MKLKLTLLSLCVLLASLSGTAWAQNIPVTGTVTNKATGEPLAGATIMARNSSAKTLTDAQGNFSITVPATGTTLVISYAGMKPVDFKVSSTATKATIQMEESATTTLSDVVVVGYGTQKITKVSGAISTIKAADIEKLRPVRTEEALQGRASGVNVIQNGSPGSKPTVLIRGIPSFSGTDPVVIIDGSPQTLTHWCCEG